jgi:hypothetical protein
MIRSSEIGWRFRQAICFLSCANTPEKLKQLNAIVLGPQASPPARVEKNQEAYSEPLDENGIGSFGHGQTGTPAVPGRSYLIIQGSV